MSVSPTEVRRGGDRRDWFPRGRGSEDGFRRLKVRYPVDRKGILRYFDVRGEDLKAAIEELLAE